MTDKKKEKIELKKRLWNWGQAMEQFSWKEEELQKLQGFHEIQRGVWEKNHAERAKQELERLEKEYHLEVGRLRIEMEEILREKRRIDEMIRGLDREEGWFLRMRKRIWV